MLVVVAAAPKGGQGMLQGQQHTHPVKRDNRAIGAPLRLEVVLALVSDQRDIRTMI